MQENGCTGDSGRGLDSLITMHSVPKIVNKGRESPEGTEVVLRAGMMHNNRDPEAYVGRVVCRFFFSFILSLYECVC